VTLAVTLCVCPPSHLYHVSTVRHTSLGGEGNVLYVMTTTTTQRMTTTTSNNDNDDDDYDNNNKCSNH